MPLMFQWDAHSQRRQMGGATNVSTVRFIEIRGCNRASVDKGGEVLRNINQIEKNARGPESSGVEICNGKGYG